MTTTIVPQTDEPRVSPRILAAIETTTARAATLILDGYTVEPIDAFRGLFFVRRQNPLIDRKTGAITEGYTVNVIDGTCDCPMFCRAVAATGDGRCKHIIAAREEVRRAFALLGLLPAVDVVASQPTRWEVWEFDPQIGEISNGHTFDTQAAAQAWCDAEEDWARAGGERVPVLRIRPVGERRPSCEVSR